MQSDFMNWFIVKSTNKKWCYHLYNINLNRLCSKSIKIDSLMKGYSQYCLLYSTDEMHRDFKNQFNGNSTNKKWCYHLYNTNLNRLCSKSIKLVAYWKVIISSDDCTVLMKCTSILSINLTLTRLIKSNCGVTISTILI